MKFKELLNNAKEYIGVEPPPISELGGLMATVVTKYGKDIYQRPSHLAEAMGEFGASGTQIRQIALIVGVDGFRDLLEKDGRVQQADLARYVGNALRETGLTRSTTLSLTSAIAFSLDIAYDYMDPVQRDVFQKGGSAYAIPVSAYESELAAFEKDLARKSKTASLSDTQMERLRVLSDVGIPQAKYYLGERILSNAEANNADPLVGIQYLEEAVEAEYPPAAAALGDYYYTHWTGGNWNRAYSYYTGFGSAALTPNRRNNLTTILNHGKYNRNLIFSTFFFLAAMLLCIVAAPGAGLFSAHRIFGGFCAAGSAALITAAFLHHRVKPYDTFYWLPLGLHTIWFLYMAVRIIW